MDYQRPVLTAMALEVGVSCCTPGNPYCEYKPPPTCHLGPLSIGNYDCGTGLPRSGVACFTTVHVGIGRFGLGGYSCI